MPSPIRPMPVPSPKSAVTIGSPIARKEPKLIRRTTIAARTPIAGRRARRARTASARSPGRRARPRAGAERMLSARAITFLIAEIGRTLARWSKRTVAKPIVPSFEMRLPAFGSKGLVTPVTCGRRATPASIGATTERTRGVGQLAGARLEDDLVDVAGLGRKAALQQVGGALGAGVAEREVARVVAADALPGRPDADQDDDPERRRRCGDASSTSGRARASADGSNCPRRSGLRSGPRRSPGCPPESLGGELRSR